MKKNIVLCADDYGQAPAISKGIFSLVKQQRLSAVSCMVNTQYWREHALWLLPFQAQIDIGLHFNLTEGQALSKQYQETYGQTFRSLPVLLRHAFLRKLDRATIEAECRAQVDEFVLAFGRLPRFIDGHQHVHQFPVIRDAVINVYEQRLRQRQAYIRLAFDPVSFSDLVHDFKKIIIQASGARAIMKRLRRHKIPHNQTFAGIYAFGKLGRYQQLFPRFLKQINDGGLIMCHPALAAPDSGDKIARARVEEYQYLLSDQFLIDCRSHAVVLQRFNHVDA